MEPPNLSNKPLENLSLDDLINALQTNTKQDDSLPLPVDLPPVIEFIQRFKLESGEHRVESRLLWNLYLQYYPATITKHVFTEHANKLLKYTKAAFYLNMPSTNLYSMLVNKSNLPAKRTNTYKSHAHFGAFFEKEKVISGEHKIPWYAFFHLYRCYCIDHKVKPRSKQAFLKYISHFFKKTTSNDGSLYLVDKVTASKIDKKEFDGLKRLYQKENHTKR